MKTFTKSGHIVDLLNNRIFPGTVHVENGVIKSIKEESTHSTDYILPGFIDSHIHIESSMLVPSEFARLAVVHGTVATISDPHEIGNVLGVKGVRYMIENGKRVPFHFYFGASPCVPATIFETSGATIDPNEIRSLFEEDHLVYLSEVMNFPGVLHKDPILMKKIEIAKSLGKPIDGHAPGLRGDQAGKYIAAGISTDHECYSLGEALDKIQYGMKILIREGSAAKNYDALSTLIQSHPKMVMFCNDDKHPNDLVKGHINDIVKKSLQMGYDRMDVLRAASLNPILHYGLDVGYLRVGDSADFIVIDGFENLSIKETYIKGDLVAKAGKTLIKPVSIKAINHFKCTSKKPQDFKVKATTSSIKVIKAISGELITEKLSEHAKIINDEYVADPATDVLKLSVINRYSDTTPAVAFIKGFGLKKGAIASSVAHDSHNIIAVGTTDEAICKAVNAIIDAKGGIAVVNDQGVEVLPLPIAGLMSDLDGYLVALQYEKIKKSAVSLGSELSDPFMTLSFMALLVIPSLKLSDKGLFDGDLFSFTPLAVC